jgi:tRNA (cmo5U34)-methyltransferase
MVESNTWLGEEGPQLIETFLTDSDVFVIERARALKLAMDIFSWNFPKPQGLSILDLGCGDGRLCRAFAKRFPSNSYILLDGSPVMLGKSRDTMKGFDATFIEETFEALIENEPDDQRFDFVLSSLAIHHLGFQQKRQLYAHIYRELRFGGLFLNYDVVLPASERVETWHFAMWRDWMNEHTNERGKFDALPDDAKAKAENKPTRLPDHLRALEESGFCDVDCHYKYSVFCLYGGTKR